ncbi:MAG: recombinase family protein [archaeon]|nr:recombinase family protein [archaeon]
MKAACYARVSTEEQAEEGYSIDAQKELLGLYCEANGLEPVYFVDDGFSGRNTRRPSYRKMIESMAGWDVLLVLKMDRIHRNTRNFMNMMDVLERKGKQFISATESLDTTNAMGRFVVSMIQSIAQLESEQIGERTVFAMREKAETMENSESSNRTMGFNEPFGYRFEGSDLVAVPDELRLVRRSFMDYIVGESLPQVAEDMYRSGYRTRRGRKWSERSVAYIFHNPIYAGYLEWDGILNRHYCGNAVDPETFNEVQMIMHSKSRNPDKKPPFLLPVGEDCGGEDTSNSDGTDGPTSVS